MGYREGENRITGYYGPRKRKKVEDEDYGEDDNEGTVGGDDDDDNNLEVEVMIEVITVR